MTEAFSHMFFQIPRAEIAALGTCFGANAVEKLFSESEVGELISLVKRLAA